MCWIMYDIIVSEKTFFVRPHESDKLALKKNSTLGPFAKNLILFAEKAVYLRTDDYKNNQ